VTIIARICEKWTMQLEPPEDEWFLDWVLRSPREAGKHLTSGWLAYQSLAGLEVTHAREYFGGIGAQSLMIQELFEPEVHYVTDYSPDAVKHLSTALPFCVDVGRADAYNDPGEIYPAQLVGLDFGDLTVWKTREGQPHRELLDRVFASEPKAVVLTDIACRYLHLHRERYESLLGAGTCVSYETYLEALLRRLQRLYGYTLVAGYWDRWSTVMALAPQGDRPMGVLRPTPASPVGIELL
jgi:hypothetical protein